MENAEKWYVRNTAGRVFGPIGLDTLKSWVRDGRVEPLAGVSNDLESWMLAPLGPDLEMDCVIENNPGQFYGPTHRSVAEDLQKSGTLARDARVYRDVRNAMEALAAEREALARERDSLRGECEDLRSARAAADAACGEAQAERDAARKERDAAEAERDAAISERDSARRERDAAIAARDEAQAELAKSAAVPAREWKTEVIVPEIVSDEPPPRAAHQAFGAAPQAAPSATAQPPFRGATTSATAMAALEAQARAELARMGAGGKKIFKFMKK